MPIDEFEERKKLLSDTRADLLKRQLSNAENHDKAVLTLSSAALGLSIGLLKDFIPISSARLPDVLYLSWYSLTAALIATVLSYYTSQHAIRRQIERAEDYYLRGSDDALPRTRSAALTDLLNYASGALFITGIVLTTLFVSVNIERASSMSYHKTIPPSGIRNGAPVPNLQEVQKGAPIPSLQKVPQPPIAPPTPAAPTAPTGDQGGGKTP